MLEKLEPGKASHTPSLPPPSHASLRALENTGVLLYRISPNIFTKGQVLWLLPMSASVQEAIQGGCVVRRSYHPNRARVGGSGCCLLAGHIPAPKAQWTLLSSHPLRPGDGVQDAQEGANSTSLKQSITYRHENGPCIQKHSVKMSFPLALWGCMKLPA